MRAKSRYRLIYMRNINFSAIPLSADRMGRFIGQLRIHEGVTLNKLSHGLCSPGFLNKVENGEREIGKQLTDALFQRLGKPVELFDRILDWDEFQRWAKRQDILAHLHRGDIQRAQVGIKDYLSQKSSVLDQQFCGIATINCDALLGASANELLQMVNETLALTQPEFQTTSIEDLLLSQNEGRLLFAHFQLREALEGFEAVDESYRVFLRYFKQNRFESRERVYLFPYIACRIVENEYQRGQYLTALTVCEDALDELSQEKRLYGYEQLLVWKQKIFDMLGKQDRSPEKLLMYLRSVCTNTPAQAQLFIPCNEVGQVYCLNQVIRDRRKLLGISQETLAEGICTPRTLIRIENHGGNLHRSNRRLLLQRVNMSGERYDYEVITDHYEDYLLRSDLTRAEAAGNTEQAKILLSQLRKHAPDTITNRQYFLKREATLQQLLPDGHPQKISLEEQEPRLRNAIMLTLPLDIDCIKEWPTCILSINETLALLSLAICYRKQRQFSKSLHILEYIRNCLLSTGVDISHYHGIFTRINATIASVAGDCGEYDRSDVLAYECIRLSLGNKNSRQVARCLYGIAWNRAQYLSVCSQQEKNRLNQEIMYILKQAYAIALISKDVAYMRLVAKYYLKTFGVEIEL